MVPPTGPKGNTEDLRNPGVLQKFFCTQKFFFDTEWSDTVGPPSLPRKPLTTVARPLGWVSPGCSVSKDACTTRLMAFRTFS